jgi:hypothetical protein
VSLQIKEMIEKKIQEKDTYWARPGKSKEMRKSIEIQLLKELLSEIEHTNSEWIPVSERLPEDGQIVTAYNSI